jgi:hypothetical protein
LAIFILFATSRHTYTKDFSSKVAYRNPDAIAAWSVAGVGMSPMTTKPSC